MLHHPLLKIVLKEHSHLRPEMKQICYVGKKSPCFRNKNRKLDGKNKQEKEMKVISLQPDVIVYSGHFRTKEHTCLNLTELK